MNQWTALLLLLAAVVYLVLPWDLDFVPVLGRLDDVALLLLALANYWKTAGRGGVREPRRERGRQGTGGDSRRGPAAGGRDPHSVLGLDGTASDEEIKKAYRHLLGRYHPDRVQHLGEEFRQMAARKTVEINGAYQRLKKERGFS